MQKKKKLVCHNRIIRNTKSYTIITTHRLKNIKEEDIK